MIFLQAFKAYNTDGYNCRREHNFNFAERTYIYSAQRFQLMWTHLRWWHYAYSQFWIWPLKVVDKTPDWCINRINV